MGEKRLLGRFTDMLGKRPDQYGDKNRSAREQRSTTPEASPSTSPSPPSDELAVAIQTCISEIAIMWLLHRFSLAAAMQSEPLDRQITDFSVAAFRAIKRFQILHGVTQRHLWLIYFKGLLTAGVPAREQILQAIRNVGTQGPIQGSKDPSTASTEKARSRIETTPNNPQGKLSDSEALEQIEKALAQTDTDG